MLLTRVACTCWVSFPFVALLLVLAVEERRAAVALNLARKVVVPALEDAEWDGSLGSVR